jgi:NAD/NADP transhydrogenase beta subunit
MAFGWRVLVPRRNALSSHETMTHDENLTAMAKTVMGVSGMTLNALAVITSMQEQIEWGFRIFSLTVGIAVGLMTIWSLLRKKPK